MLSLQCLGFSITFTVFVKDKLFYVFDIFLVFYVIITKELYKSNSSTLMCCTESFQLFI